MDSPLVPTIAPIADSLMKISADESVRNFACGTGEFCFIAAKNGARTEGFDFNEISIDKANQN